MSSAAYAFTSPQNDSDKLSVALFFAGALHAILLLGLVFSAEQSPPITSLPSVDIILVQNQNNETPDEADFIAQSNQSGGGDLDVAKNPSNPFTSNQLEHNNGIALEQTQAGNPKQATNTAPLVITKIYASEKINAPDETVDAQDDQPEKNSLSELDLQIAKLSAQLDKITEINAKRPKRLQVSASTKASYVAEYMIRWIEKIERIGNLNLPMNIARQNLEGRLILEVELRHDGQLIEVNILRSSNNPTLDSAAKHIVDLATPFEPFTPELRKHADHIEIVRTWEFSKSGLETRYQ